MKEIPLTQGKIALIDDEDFELISQYNWFAHKGEKGHWYTKAYIGNYEYVLMHTLLVNSSLSTEVDHIDGNGLNNQKSNLRECTHSQNMMNTTKRKNATSQFKGVSWCNQTSKWRAVINLNGDYIHLGRFASEEEAARAYDKSARKLFGEFAKPNFIKGGDFNGD